MKYDYHQAASAQALADLAKLPKLQAAAKDERRPLLEQIPPSCEDLTRIAIERNQ